MRILILGSNGQLGSSILEKLENNSLGGIQIDALSREGLDITNENEVEKKFEIHRPDTVINCAAWTDVAGAEKNYGIANDVNFNGVVNITRAAGKFNSRIIQISTDYVFDGSQHSPINESEVQNPINRYGETKSAAEKFLSREYKENSIIVRTAWLYGPYGKNFARTMIRKALTPSDAKIRVVNDQLGQPTSTLDLASRILEIATSPLRCGIYHGTNSGSTSWYEFAKLLLESAEIESERLIPILSSDFPSNVERPKYSVLGHESWRSQSFPAMRPWENAVQDLALRIRREIEEKDGI